MTHMRADKVSKVADFIPPQRLEQGEPGGLVVVGWGSTYGTVHKAVGDCIQSGLRVAQIHLRHLNPLPKNLSELLSRFDEILVPELNNGQLATILRDKLLIHVHQLNKVSGQPFTVTEVKRAIHEHARAHVREVQP
jgi:2-oxoglutarate ferredoxin oxidoreductase subunit alpha